MICSITQPGISYVYDYAGNTDNIVKETRTSGSYAGETTYAYDTLGQLTRVNDPVENATWVYTYDRGGNILNKKRYAYTTGTVGTVQQTISYTYNSAWKDKLATYNGITLTHDAGGNLTNDGSWTYGWQAGRELLNMTHANGTYVHYDYDHNGMRVRKTAAGVATNYTVNGKHVTHLVKGSDWMHFFYDGQGRPAIVNYNNATYHYLYNLQGDVIGLIDTSGSVVVEYKYDAWGKIIARTGSLVSTLGYLNPFRYRGYVYDEETGLYYLRSRYYNPEWGRFINTDEAAFLSADNSVFSCNLFLYCKNNPISGIDPSGHWDWGGVLLGLGLVVSTIAIVAASAVITPLGALAAGAAITTGAVMAGTAMVDGVMVADLSMSGMPGKGKVGISAVVDFKNDEISVYTHGGGNTSDSTLNMSYSVGVVLNYSEPEDYSAHFFDGNVSCGNVGVDYCWDPTKSPNDATQAISISFSWLKQKSVGGGVGYDYYSQPATVSWK